MHDMRSETEQKLVNEMKRPMTSQGRRPNKLGEQESKPSQHQEEKPVSTLSNMVLTQRQKERGHLTTDMMTMSEGGLFYSPETASKEVTRNII